MTSIKKLSLNSEQHRSATRNHHQRPLQALGNWILSLDNVILERQFLNEMLNRTG